MVGTNCGVTAPTLKVVCNGKMTWAYIVVMNIGMCDLVILCLVYPPQEF